jgi:hypothetical protein
MTTMTESQALYSHSTAIRSLLSFDSANQYKIVHGNSLAQSHITIPLTAEMVATLIDSHHNPLLVAQIQELQSQYKSLVEVFHELFKRLLASSRKVERITESALSEVYSFWKI